MQTIELFIVRDAADGSILLVTDDKEDAEFEAVTLLGTFSGSEQDPIPTRPVLETHLVELGEPCGEPRSGASLRRRVATRLRRRDREYEATAAEFRAKYPPEPDELLTAAEVMELLGTARATLDTLRRNGHEPSDNGRRYSRRAIEAALQAGRN